MNRLIASLVCPLALALIPPTAGAEQKQVTGAELPDLAKHRWTNRVLVIDTPTIATTEAYRAQATELLPAWEGLLERDLLIVTREGAAAFRVRLVGKDGEVKLDSNEPVGAAELFALIDAMPMRRAETKQRK
jgi:hypothetical protein